MARAEGVTQEEVRGYVEFLETQFEEARPREVPAGDLRCIIDDRLPVHYTHVPETPENQHVTISKSDVHFFLFLTRRLNSAFRYQAWIQRQAAATLAQAEHAALHFFAQQEHGVEVNTPNQNLHFYFDVDAGGNRTSLADVLNRARRYFREEFEVQGSIVGEGRGPQGTGVMALAHFSGESFALWDKIKVKLRDQSAQGFLAHVGRVPGARQLTADDFGGGPADPRRWILRQDEERHAETFWDDLALFVAEQTLDR